MTPWIEQARSPCPSQTPIVYSNSCPPSWWCHPANLSPVVPFSSCPQSFPALGSFPMNQLVTWGGQSIGVSASASVLPMNTQDWSLLGWTGWISLQSKGLSRVFSNTTVQKHQFFSAITVQSQGIWFRPYLNGLVVFLAFFNLPYLQAKMEKLYIVRKKQDWELTGSDHELLMGKFRVKLKKVGKTTRPFMCDLNQIPYDYAM